MRRVRFRGPAGLVRSGEWTNQAIEFGGRRYDPEDVDILSPTDPTKVIVTGYNYPDLIERLGVRTPTHPRLFFKTPNTVVGHGATVTVPRGVTAVYEGELGVVVGRQCRNVPAEEAMSVVAGFTCVDDMAIDDDLEDDPGAVRTSGFDGATPIGPVIAPPEAVPDEPTLEVRVNGEVERTAAFADPLFSVADIVAEITRYITLEPGDVFTTGTPIEPGPVADGDRVEIEIEGIGTLEHDVETLD